GVGGGGMGEAHAPRLGGEGRGEGRRQTPTPAYAAAPHPNPLPIEEWGEGTCMASHEARQHHFAQHTGRRHPLVFGAVVAGGNGDDKFHLRHDPNPPPPPPPPPPPSPA